jgi:hypothetical protein
VPIDTTTPTGQAFEQLAKELFQRRRRLEALYAYYRGEPPLPEGMTNLRDQAADFFRTSRTNFAELICEALRERMKPAGVRTGVDDDESGDEVAWKLWLSCNLPVVSADVHQWMCALGEGYAIVSWSEGKNRPVVTAEDPRQVLTRHDPLTDDVVDAIKLYRDDIAKLDIAYVYLPGAVRVATRKVSNIVLTDTTFKAGDWEWDEDRSADLPAGFENVIPVVRFRNRDGVGEFERHVDVLDRINRALLRGLVVMTHQAFKQRAVTGDLPEYDEAGNPINYKDLLRAGPDALWLLPPDAKIWESGQADINPILNFAKNDVLFLAAVTRTPLTMFTPDAATQSAEGASLQREGLVFKAEDRMARVSGPWAEVLSLMLRFAGEDERAAVEDIHMLWAPVERFSVGERANAIAQTTGVISKRQQLIEIWGMSPDQANRNLTELVDDQLLAQQTAQLAAPPQPPAVQQPGEPAEQQPSEVPAQ